MMKMPLKRIAELIGGELHGKSVEVRGMIHDTRLIEPGNLFCALVGDHHDGHDFIGQAASQGAAAALVSRLIDHPLPQLVGEDVLEAMCRLASAWRDQHKTMLIGITGSNGKTTTKEMLAEILETQGPTLATSGNYNNEIGVPLTLARLSSKHKFCVIEMGAGAPGDIAYLTDMAKPDVGIVTNAAAAHLEGFGSIDAVARTKGELFEALPASGLAVINADDAYASLWQQMASHCRTITFGMASDAVVRGRIAHGRVHVEIPSGRFDFKPRLPGRHNVLNALAATAVAVALEVPLNAISSALSVIESLPGRLQAHHHKGWVLIDDTYNANPASLYAGLQVLGEYGGERWLVLGDMAELGPDSEKLHAEMGQAALDMGISRLFTLGPTSRRSTIVFGPGANHFETHEALAQALSGSIEPGVTCLIKGSRAMGMERIVQALLGEKT